MMHFSPLFQIFPYFQKMLDSEENFHNFTFSRQISSFSSAEISDDLFFSHQPHISNFHPIFPVSIHFPPVSRKLLFPPTFTIFPSVLDKFTYFLHTLLVFRFPPTLTMMNLCITQCTYWTPPCQNRKSPLHVCPIIYVQHSLS